MVLSRGEICLLKASLNLPVQLGLLKWQGLDYKWSMIMDCVPLRFYYLGYSATGLSDAQSQCVFKECMKPFVFCVTSVYTLELGCRSTSWNCKSVAHHLMSPTRTSAVVLFTSPFGLDDCSFMCTSLEIWCLHSAQLSETGCCTYLFFVLIYILVLCTTTTVWH